MDHALRTTVQSTEDIDKVPAIMGIIFFWRPSLEGEDNTQVNSKANCQRIKCYYERILVFQVALVVKNLPASAEVRDVGLIPSWKDPLEEGMATHSISLPRESHGQRSFVGYSPWGLRVGCD